MWWLWSVDWLVRIGRSVMISLKRRKLHFHARIGGTNEAPSLLPFTSLPEGSNALMVMGSRSLTLTSDDKEGREFMSEVRAVMPEVREASEEPWSPQPSLGRSNPDSIV